MIELELLAFVWAVKNYSMFLRGLKKFQVIVDHKPLIPIMNQYTLADVSNPRLLRLKEKLSEYCFEAVWLKGKEHLIPDALSRGPVDYPLEDYLELEAEMGRDVKKALQINVRAVDVEESETNVDPLLKALKEAVESDSEYQRLKQAVIQGFPGNMKVAVLL